MNLKKVLIYLTLAGILLNLGFKKDKPVSDLENKLFYTPAEKHWYYHELGFNPSEEISYDFLDGTPELAEEYAKAKQTPKETILNLALGIKPEEVNEFKNTEKPDALLIYSKSDNRNAFVYKSHLNFLKQIKENYDVSLSVCKDDKEVGKALDKIKYPDLIIFGGHGIEGYYILLNDSVFSEQGNRSERGIESKYTFDMNDEELFEKLSKKGKATCIFINCSSGKYFAPCVKDNAPDLRVFGAKEDFYIGSVKINSVNPFDVSFYDLEGKDCTYRK